VQTALSAPAILLDGSLAATPAMIRRLGALLGRNAHAEDVAQVCAKSLSEVAAVATAVPLDARPTVYYGRGADGLEALRPGNVNSEVIDFAGGRNVAPSGKGTFVRLNIDELKGLAPSFVIVSDPAAAADGSPLRMALAPTTRFLVDAGRPFAWVEGPPSLNRIVGIRWLANQLYPNRIDFDPALERDLNRALFDVTN
jgi:iron complex transport system substrate-binding protein